MEIEGAALLLIERHGILAIACAWLNPRLGG